MIPPHPSAYDRRFTAHATLLKFIVRRLLTIPITLLVITAMLYGIIMFTPPEQRAELYLTGLSPHITEEQLQKLIDRAIKDHGLDQPFPVQYMNWLRTLIKGEWGWSPMFRAPVSDLITARAPTSIELTLYTMLFYIPVGIASGIIASRRRNRVPDHVFRLSAFTATSVPPFILGLMMLSLFYVGLGWGGTGRVSDPVQRIINSPDFKVYTGLYTIDGLINGRLNVTLDALQHLVMPVLALSALHWATVGRVTRTVMIDESDKPYIIAAEARGIPDQRIYWKHAARNALVPALTNSVLGAASLLTGVYVIERVFNLHGVSELIVATGVAALADAPLAMGFALYRVIVVLIMMVVLDIAQAIVDPRMRERLTQ